MRLGADQTMLFARPYADRPKASERLFSANMRRKRARDFPRLIVRQRLRAQHGRRGKSLLGNRPQVFAGLDLPPIDWRKGNPDYSLHSRRWTALGISLNDALLDAAGSQEDSVCERSTNGRNGSRGQGHRNWSTCVEVPLLGIGLRS